MGVWNYRILKHRRKPDEMLLTGETHWYGLHEVYYDKRGGQPNSYTADPITFVSDETGGDEGIIGSLERALADARKWPVIDVEETFPEEAKNER